MTIPPEKPRRRVQLESPFAGKTPQDLTDNAAYLTACLRDSLLRGEAPFASHRLYTEALDDKDPEERQTGIEAGLAYVEVAEATVVYMDRGISGGMHVGIERAEAAGRPVEMRSLNVMPAPATEERYVPPAITHEEPLILAVTRDDDGALLVYVGGDRYVKDSAGEYVPAAGETAWTALADREEDEKPIFGRTKVNAMRDRIGELEAIVGADGQIVAGRRAATKAVRAACKPAAGTDDGEAYWVQRNGAARVLVIEVDAVLAALKGDD